MPRRDRVELELLRAEWQSEGESSLAISDDFLYFLDELFQRVDNRLVFNGVGIIERYLHSPFYLVLRIRSENSPFDDHLFFNRAPGRVNLIESPGIVLDKSEPGAPKVYGKQVSVLISTVENMKSEEKIVPSVVRFQLGDPSHYVGPEHLYFSLASGLCKIIKTPSEGELYSVKVPDAEGHADIAQQNIQGASQVMNGISRDKVGIERDFFHLAYLNEFVDSIVIRLDAEFARAFNKRPDNLAKIEDMLFGPIDFLPSNSDIHA
jgi:hypothetical protein